MNDAEIKKVYDILSEECSLEGLEEVPKDIKKFFINGYDGIDIYPCLAVWVKFEEDEDRIVCLHEDGKSAIFGYWKPESEGRATRIESQYVDTEFIMYQHNKRRNGSV